MVLTRLRHKQCTLFRIVHCTSWQLTFMSIIYCFVRSTTILKLPVWKCVWCLWKYLCQYQTVFSTKSIDITDDSIIPTSHSSFQLHLTSEMCSVVIATRPVGQVQVLPLSGPDLQINCVYRCSSIIESFTSASSRLL